MRSNINEVDDVLEPAWLNILVGDLNENIVDALVDGMFGTPDSLFYLNCCTSLWDTDIIAAAKTREFDLAVLVLNNIRFESQPLLAIENRPELALELVARLKQEFSIPIVALYGYPNGSEYSDRAIEAGAKFATALPCDVETLDKQIMSAFVEGLRMTYLSYPPHNR